MFRHSLINSFRGVEQTGAAFEGLVRSFLISWKGSIYGLGLAPMAQDKRGAKEVEVELAQR